MGNRLAFMEIMPVVMTDEIASFLASKYTTSIQFTHPATRL
jgi:hypothetical protein